MFRRGFSRLGAVLVVAGVAVAGLVLYPRLRPAGQPGGDSTAACQSNLKQIGLGLLQYSQDYDGRFPPRTGSKQTYGWVNAVMPYAKSLQLFRCPQVETERTDDPRQLGYTDYWMNANLFTVSNEKLREPSLLALCGDGNDGSDATTARYSAAVLPRTWTQNHASPAYRHKDGLNILFADGHVKLMKPAQFAESPKPGFVSFELK